jgi:hypothetical protein
MDCALQPRPALVASQACQEASRDGMAFFPYFYCALTA